MQTTINDTVDKAAMALGAGLMFVGIAVLGIVELLDGPPYGAAPMTNDAGEIVATPMVDPNLRVGLVVAGLAVLLVWQLYRMAATPEGETTTKHVETAAD